MDGLAAGAVASLPCVVHWTLELPQFPVTEEMEQICFRCPLPALSSSVMKVFTVLLSHQALTVKEADKAGAFPPA